jgi:hypothetical protein
MKGSNTMLKAGAITTFNGWACLFWKHDSWCCINLTTKHGMRLLHVIFLLCCVQAQWQQANPAEQQLLAKLQQEHQQLQQQLAAAQQQIARLEAGSTSTSAAAAAAQTHVQQTSSSSSCKQTATLQRTSMVGSTTSNSRAALQQQCQQQQQQQEDELEEPRPGVQVLRICRTGSNNSSDDSEDGSRQQPASTTAAALAKASHLQQQVQSICDAAEQQPAASARQQQQQPAGQAALLNAPSSARGSTSNRNSPRTTSARQNTAAADGGGNGSAPTASKAAGRRATSTGFAPADSSSKVAPSRRASVAARPMSSSSNSSSAAALKLLSLEQQQALVERLQHAEQVMQMLHGDLQASLLQQQQLAQQLEQSQAAEQQLQQQHQVQQQQQHQGQQQAHEESCQPEGNTAATEQHAQVVLQLEDVRQQLCDVQQQLAQAQQASALADAQRVELQVQLELQAAQNIACEAELEQCIQQLQQQLEVALLNQSAAAEQQRQAGAGVSDRRLTGAAGDSAADAGLHQACTALADAAETQYTMGCSHSSSSSSSNTLQESSTQAGSGAAVQPDSILRSTATEDQQATWETQLSGFELEQQQEVQPCARYKQLEQQLEHLQHALQHATGSESTDEPGLTAAASNSQVVTQSAGHTASASSRQHRQAVLHVRQQRPQQQLPMKTWICPVAPEIAALQASVAAGQGQPLSAREHGAWLTQAASGCGDIAINGDDSSSTVMPEALMLAGVRKMRPLSYSPTQAAGSSSLPTGGLVGTAMTSRSSAKTAMRSSRQQAVGLSAGAEQLLREGLLAGQFEQRERQQAFLQLVGDASYSGGVCQVAGSSATCTAMSGNHSAGLAAVPQLVQQQPMFSAVRWTCRSSSPRRGSPRQLTPRSARPASAAPDMCDAGVHGSMLAQISSRPQTTRSHNRGQCDHTSGGCMIMTTTRSMLRAGSAPSKPGAVPKLNLSALRS